ncbi:MAG: UDP-N-acetylmuramoyl-L-alanyl-D-glutamate--2,6-diaminopimelate ligase [Phycisphaeraceae bacterium]|nr:UDP-N-acetylmuramoyl-L-alanyl-D-glutamate--2,6-diaminopimelate ligase [Phycisphaeraceae bacterium]
MLLSALIQDLGLEPSGGPALPVRVCDITEDSRTVMPGSLFVARLGARTDGRVHIPAAVRAGAVAVLCDRPAPASLVLPPGVALLTADDVPLAAARLAERFYGNPSRRLGCVGVTGTNGKTTITWLIHQLLNHGALRCGLIGTVIVDDGSEPAPASLTTPPALEISRLLAKMLECGCRAAAMEVSSHALDQRRVAALRFSAGVFTNLSHDHLDYHGTMERYADAKALLFAMLPPADDGGLAIVNADDPWHRRMLADCRARVWRCTLSGQPGCDLSASILASGPAWTDFSLAAPWGRWERVRLPLIGDHNVMNAVQAAAGAVHAGLAPSRVLELLPSLTAPPGRMQPVSRPGDPIGVYVDYAHSDDSLRRVLAVCRTAVQRSGRGRVRVVFGCGGDRDRAKRPKMGAAAAELADAVTITSDNPRTEDPRAIIDAVLAGVPPHARAKVAVEPDRARAIASAVAAANDADIVLIAGKGHEDYQILPDGRGGTSRIHFDDAEHARAALAARGIAVIVPRVSPAGGRSSSPGAGGGAVGGSAP